MEAIEKMDLLFSLCHHVRKFFLLMGTDQGTKQDETTDTKSAFSAFDKKCSGSVKTLGG